MSKLQDIFVNDIASEDNDDLLSVSSLGNTYSHNQSTKDISNSENTNISSSNNYNNNSKRNVPIPSGASRNGQVADLSHLASANFLSESLTENGNMTLINLAFAPATPTFAGTNGSFSPTLSVNQHYRKYSGNSLSNSPKLVASNGPTMLRSRPKSGLFLLDASNFAIAEDDDVSVQSSIDNTPRSRNADFLQQKLGQNGAVLASPYRSSSPVRNASPSRMPRSYGSKSPVRRSSSPSKSYQPFNFQPQELMLHSNNSGLSLQVKPAHRKGHKYKHSSISMNLFQEPPPALSLSNKALNVPDLYPIPNFRELILSVKPAQKFRLSWSVFHLVMALFIFVVGFKFSLPSFSTLAHLVFYDSLGSLVIVFVDIMSNFEVWNNSSIAYPFGLGRLEVLVGFALSASLIMVGFDLVSHFIEEFIILMYISEGAEPHEGEQHLSHHIHGENGSNANWFVYELVLLFTIAVTLISSNKVLAHDKINEIISTQEPNKSKGGILEEGFLSSKSSKFLTEFQKFINICTRNPTHLLTLIYSTFLVVVPLIPELIVNESAFDLNDIATLVVSLSLVYTGWKLVKTLGGILLCSYPYSDYDYHVLKSNIMDSIMAVDAFKRSHTIDKFYITKFKYDFYVVGLKVVMKGADPDEESTLRYEVDRIIRNEIKNLNEGNTRIEITIDIDRF